MPTKTMKKKKTTAKASKKKRATASVTTPTTSASTATNTNNGSGSDDNTTATSSNDDFTVIDILPSSDRLDQRTTATAGDSKVLECYYASIQIKRNHILSDTTTIQSVCVGDILAIRIDEQCSNSNFAYTNREPFLGNPTKKAISWGVGQVLSIFSCLSNDSTSSCSNQSSSNSAVFKSHIKWFVPFISKTTDLLLREEDIKNLKRIHRPQFMLLEQQALSDVICVNTDVLPAYVVLDKIEASQFRDATTSKEIIPGCCYEIPFLCKQQIVGDKQPPARCIDNDFCDRRTNGNTPNASCIRGWDSWQKKEPDLFKSDSILRNAIMMPQLLQESRFWITPDTKKPIVEDADESAIVTYSSSDNGSKSEVEPSEETLRPVENESIEEAPTKNVKKKSAAKKTVSKAKTDKKHSVKKNNKLMISANKKAPAKRSTRKATMVSSVEEDSSTNSSEGSRVASRKKRTRQESDDEFSVNDGKTKKITKKSNRQLKMVEPENNDDRTEEDTTMPKPIGEVLYEYREPIIVAKQRKKPKLQDYDDEGPPAAQLLSFYSGVQIPMDWNNVARGITTTTKLNRSKISTWNIHIGDIIAMACKQSFSDQSVYTITKGSKPKLNTDQEGVIRKKDEWFPFNRPWSPAQVIAIYQKKEISSTGDNSDYNSTAKGRKKQRQVFVQLQWLFRPNELTNDIQLTNDQRTDLFRFSESRAVDDAKSNNEILLSGRNFIDVDNCIGEAFAEGALGRITTRVSSDDSCDNSDLSLWLSDFVGKDGIPHVPIFVRYAALMYFDSSNQLHSDDKTATSKKNKKRQLSTVTGWSDFTSRIQGPLSRLLLCPDSYPGQIKDLQHHYELFVHQRINRQTDEEIVSKKPAKLHAKFDSPTSSSQESASVSTSWPKELLQWEGTRDVDRKNKTNYKFSRDLLYSQNLQNGKQRSFFQTISVPIINRRFDPRATGKKSMNDLKEWTLKMGDIVCVVKNGVKREHANDRSGKNKINPWYPFVGPWKVCQILSIYYDTNVVSMEKDSTIDTSSFLCEVRWFHRKSDMPAYVAPWIPSSHSSRQEEDEVFETDVVEDGVPLSYVLGCVDLFLGHHIQPSNLHDKSVPSALCRCRSFYFSQYERFQPIFCAETCPKAWFRTLLERGLRFSSLIDQDKLLSSVVQVLFDVELKGQSNLFGNMQSDEKQRALEDSGQPMPFTLPLGEGMQGLTYSLSISVVPQWSEFANSEIVCPTGDRHGIRWMVRVGDVVAVKTTSLIKTPRLGSFPFKCEWMPAQILAICFDQTGVDKLVRVQLRWFYRKTDHPSLDNEIGSSIFDSIYETDHISPNLVELTYLLGPINLVFGDRIESFRRVWQNAAPYLPAVVYVFGGSFSTKECCRVKETSNRNMIERGIDLSDHYGKKGRALVLDGLKKDMENSLEVSTFSQMSMQAFSRDFSLLEATDTRRAIKKNSAKLCAANGDHAAWTSVPPFHIDKSTGLQYFTEVDVQPPYSDYMLRPSAKLNVQTPIWTVRLGDLVTLNYAGHKVSKAAYGMKSPDYSKGGDHWPFAISWSVAEVVTITKQQRTTDQDSDKEIEIKFGVRWFYRQHEMPSMNRNSGVAELKSEEIFETDHYDEVETACLLGPIDLHEDPIPVIEPKFRLGIPIIDFFCKRFFSIHRKSLVPVAGLSDRIRRGQAKYPIIGNDAALRVSLDRVFSFVGKTTDTKLEESYETNFISWEASFQDVITKLSLTDASKEASHKSSGLVGREKERRQIATFLRSAIRGEAGDSTKPSVFVAGPPGVGKTACIRAVVNDLKHEQADGLLPEFDFVSLNGMEMRHPLDAYVKLLGEMNSAEQSITVERASSNLESYFSGRKVKSMADSANGRIVVVLLDEIDYMVTKKQTVLYNFFDWPMRSLELGSKNRLIVIGVSNTLNLPERLHPRVQSRIGSKRIFFKSYNVDETVAILMAKIRQASSNYNVFDEDAILFAAKKTAALSGDIRKAFQICRTAAEMILNDTQANATEGNICPMVRIKDVLKVSRESSNTAHSRFVASCTPFEVLLLISLASLAKSTGREFGRFDVEELTTKMGAIANASGNQLYLPAPDLSETLTILTRLGEADLVSMETPRNASLSCRASLVGSGGAWPLVALIIDDHAILQALKNTCHNELARKYLLSTY